MKQRSFMGRTATEWRLFCEAWFWLAFARTALKGFPFRQISLLLGKQGAETPDTLAKEAAVPLDQLRWAILAVSRRAPWRCLCLEQAIAAKLMLKTRKIPCTLYLGMMRDDDELKAHAWLRCGAHIVTGNQGLDKYTQITTFGA